MSNEKKELRKEKLVATFQNGAAVESIVYHRVLNEDGTIKHYIDESGKETKTLVFKTLLKKPKE